LNNLDSNFIGILALLGGAFTIIIIFSIVGLRGKAKAKRDEVSVLDRLNNLEPNINYKLKLLDDIINQKLKSLELGQSHLVLEINRILKETSKIIQDLEKSSKVYNTKNTKTLTNLSIDIEAQKLILSKIVDQIKDIYPINLELTASEIKHLKSTKILDNKVKKIPTYKQEVKSKADRDQIDCLWDEEEFDSWAYAQAELHFYE